MLSRNDDPARPAAFAALPQPLRTLDFVMRDGAVIRVRQHGNPTGPRLLLSHGNGFAIDGYFPFWRLFLERFEVLVYDQRNHGQNPRHRAEAHGFASFADDLGRLLEDLPVALGPKPTTGLFHSVSAIASIVHALERGWRYAALVLFDPPLAPPSGHDLSPASRAEETELSRRAARRRQRFDNPEELAEKFRRASGTRPWVAGASEIMARAVLRRCAGTGGFELACPPAWEAQVFAENRGLDLTPHLAALGRPMLFLCADPEAPGASVPALVNRAMARAHGYPYRILPGAGHMLQLEQPDNCARIVCEFLAQHGVA